MSLFSSINTASSGLTAQRLRMDVISDNLANANTTRTTEGGPYRRSRVLLRPRETKMQFRSPLLPNAFKPEAGEGVRVVKIEKDMKPLRYVFDPEHPDAMKTGPKKGYVAMPNVSVVEEMVDMISASRSYEANVSMVNSAKSMYKSALSIGRV